MAFEINEFKHNGKQVYGSNFSGAVKGVNPSARTITLIASDESVDRDGDIISVKGWQLENYLKKALDPINWTA